jgi:hypothetical protein
MRIRLALFVLTCLLLGSSLVGQQGPHTFISVLRADGALVPFAIFDGREWWNRWPWATESDEIRSIEVPATLADVPSDWLPPNVRLPVAWSVLQQDGRRMTVQISRPVRPAGESIELMDTIGLASNHPASRLVRTTMAMEEIGFAIAGSGELGRFVRPGPDESRRVLKQVANRLDQIERTALAEWYRERKENDPAGEQVTLTRTYRGTFRGPDFDVIRPERSMNGRFHYFLSGEKLFLLGLKSEPDCKLNVSFSGVIVGTVDGKVMSSQLHADPYDGFCGDWGELVTPLAVLRLRSRETWILKVSAEDGYDYVLLDPVTSNPIILKEPWGLRSNR